MRGGERIVWAIFEDKIGDAAQGRVVNDFLWGGTESNIIDFDGKAMEGERGRGRRIIIGSILERFCLRKWCNIHAVLSPIGVKDFNLYIHHFSFWSNIRWKSPLVGGNLRV